jgi:hypothetical protein
MPFQNGIQNKLTKLAFMAALKLTGKYFGYTVRAGIDLEISLFG